MARFAPDKQNALMVRKSSVAAADANALLHASKLYPGVSKHQCQQRHEELLTCLLQLQQELQQRCNLRTH